jgi:preprotein translocase subunit SecD
MKLKLTWKIWLLIFFLVFSLLSIFGNPFELNEQGVLVKNVEKNSTAFEQGLRPGQIIEFVDGEKINSLEDFSNIMSDKFISGEKVKLIIQTDSLEIILYTNITPEIIVSGISKTNIRLGLDLEGGSRALIKAQDYDLSSEEVHDLVDVVNNRLNVYGLTDLRVLPVSDLSGDNFMLIEIAGATPEDLKELISQQGKFEAKIGNETVFTGGDKDISSVCRNDATCAGIRNCGASGSGYICEFEFVVYLSEKAAERHADITKDLEVNITSSGSYLEKKLDFYLDDKFLEDESLLISEGLKGRVTTQIAISGSGSGSTEDEAYDDAEQSMHKLQTILITGSLPYKLEIVKLDTISPQLGNDFLKSIFLAASASLLAVAIIIFIRYKKIKSSLAVLLTSISEIIIILGVASFIKWNLDLPSIAGILATIGTGIDQQIIILDEAQQKVTLSIKQKLKRAFAIILGAYFTALVALFPLIWAGAGLLKGFAITTIIGITAGVLITRPAFVDIVKKIEE